MQFSSTCIVSYILYVIVSICLFHVELGLQTVMGVAGNRLLTGSGSIYLLSFLTGAS